MPLFLLLLYRCAGCGATPNPHGCAVRAGICSGWLRRRAGGAGLCYTAARRVPPAKAGGQVLQAALVLPHGTFAHAEHLRCRPHGSAALHQIPPNLHGALFGVTFHRTCPPNRFFNGMRRAVGLCGQCWRAGHRHGTIRSEQIFFSNAETLCPPGSLSQCKALQKQTQENAPMCSIKIIIVDKNWR